MIKISAYLSNLNVCICSLLQVLECYIISIEFFIIPLIWALWIMLPAYVPNPVAALLGGGTPIDLGKNYSDGNRIFGDGKTYRGLITGILAGIITGLILIWLAGQFPAASLPEHTLLSVTLLATGALLGDLVKSFFKRRFKRNGGQNGRSPTSMILSQVRSFSCSSGIPHGSLPRSRSRCFLSSLS